MNVYYWLGYNFSRLVGRFFFSLRVIHRDRVIYFLARRTLMDVPLLGWFLPKLNVIPVNQEGIDRSAIKALIRVLKSGNAALVFPEGSRTVDGNLQPAE